MFSDVDIEDAIAEGDIKIIGPDLYIGPASVDLHLDNKMKCLSITRQVALDSSIDNSDAFESYDGWDELIIHPGGFYVLSTVENITLANGIAGFVHGRSSLARIGLNIHMAGFVDPGFSGNVTLEVTNFTGVPIILKKNMRIGQMTFIRTESMSRTPYNLKKDSKYNNQSGPTLSKIHQDE